MESSFADNLKVFLQSSIFPLSKVSDQFAVKLLAPDQMPRWIAAFTHESVNVNPASNYDQFEKLGDSVMKTCFLQFILTKYPNMDSNGLSELSAYYLSKPKLAEISNSLGLTNYVQISVKKSISVSEDLFESLIGALFWIGNVAILPGMGFVFAFNFVNNIFSQVEIDLGVVAGHVKSQVKEIFEKLGWKKAIEDWRQEPGSSEGVFILRFTTEALRFLRNLGVNLNDDVLASSQLASTKKVASDQAYQQAVANLASLGIDRNWADDYRRVQEIQSPEFSKFLPGVIARMTNEGYSNVYFENVKVNSETSTVQLIGVSPTGEKKVLIQITRPGRDIEAIRKEVLSAYSEGK